MAQREHIPGCIRSLELTPKPKWPVALRNTRALHGVLTQVWGKPHERREPNFTLLPWRGGCEWAAQWVVEGAEHLPTQVEVNVFNAVRTLRFGPPMRILLPPPPPAAHHLVELHTRTPIVIRHSGLTRSTVEASNLTSALSLSPVLKRVWPEVEDVSVKVVASDTNSSKVLVGGEWGGSGTVVGWEGRLALLVSPGARRLLDLAALLGLGGRTSLGFGRFTLKEVART